MSDINYTDRNWRVELPKTEREWKVMVTIFNEFGVALHDVTFSTMWGYISPNQRVGDDDGGDHTREMARGEHTTLPTVSLYEAIARLTTPEKSERDVKLEELSKTVADAQEQIRKLQEGDK